MTISYRETKYGTWLCVYRFKGVEFVGAGKTKIAAYRSVLGVIRRIQNGCEAIPTQQSGKPH